MEGGWLLQLHQCRDFPSILLQLPHRAPVMGGRWLPLLSANGSSPTPAFVLGDQGEKGPRGLTGQSDPGI